MINNVDPDGAGPLGPRVPVGGTFAGEVVDESIVLIKYTYYGDVDFDGAVDAADYALVENGFNFQNDPIAGPGLCNWAKGDMNFDGRIDAADYALIDNAFNFQSGTLAAAGSAPASGGPPMYMRGWTRPRRARL